VKHLTFADRSLLVGDEVAEALLEYAVLVADGGHADSVTITAFAADGDEVRATFLLNSGTVLMVETSRTSMNAPDNSEAIAYLRARIAELRSPPRAFPTDRRESGGRYIEYD
jgi:hypothetical protein